MTITSSSLKSSWAAPILRLCGTVFCTLAAGCAVLSLLVAMTTTTNPVIGVSDDTALGTGFSFLVTLVSGLAISLILGTIGGLCLGLARLIVCAEQADGWLRAMVRNTSPQDGSERVTTWPDTQRRPTHTTTAVPSSHIQPPPDVF